MQDHVHALFAFDFTPDLSANCGHWNLVKHGSLRLEVRFEKALSMAINCIVYAEFDNVLEIDFVKSLSSFPVRPYGYFSMASARKLFSPSLHIFFSSKITRDDEKNFNLVCDTDASIS